MTAAPRPVDAGQPSFVGRTRELGWLRSLLAEAAQGEARLALISGEPGVGKTRLVRQFLAEADALGWQTVWGHCSVDAGSPHLPFAMGLVPQFERAGLLSHDEAQAIWRGDDAPMVAAGLAEKTVALAARRPLVFVIDDYQFGEPSTLRLIGEYARQATEISRREPVRFLLLVTHHPPLAGDAFGDALERLRREPTARAIGLAGLAEVEVHELVRSTFSNNCDPQLLGMLLQATGGNPLFVLEALRHLERRHLLSTDGGTVTMTRSAATLPLTLGVSVSLAERLRSVDASVLAITQAGALFGDTFDIADVAAVAGVPDVEEAVDRAVAYGLFEPIGAEFGFTHGMVRTAASESIGPMRRRELHRRIAQHLLERHRADGSDAIRLAHHVLASESWPDAAQAGSLYAAAGEVALESFTWGTAQRFFEAALALPEYVGGLAARELGWLEARAARANGNNGDQLRSRERYYTALGHFRACRELDGWGLALLGWQRTFSGLNEDPPDRGEYDEFFAAAGKEAVDVRCQLTTHRAQQLWAARDAGDLEAGAHAFELSRESSDAQTRAYGSVTYGLILNRHLRPREALELFNLSAREADETRNPRLQGWGRARAAIPLVVQGELAKALQACEDERELAWRGNDLSNGPLNLAVFHTAALLKGDFPLARELRVDGGNYGRRASYPAASFILDAGVAIERLWRGEFEEALDAVNSWDRAGGAGFSRPLRLLALARSGQGQEVRNSLNANPLDYAGTVVDFSSVGPLAVAAQLADEMADPALARQVLELVEPVLRRDVEFSVAPPVLLTRAAAAAARVCGDFRRAAELLGQAEEVAASAGAEPEAALVAFERASLLAATRAPAKEIEAAIARAGEALWALDMVGETSRLLELAERCRVNARAAGAGALRGDASGVELEVIEGLARGLTPDQIADGLLISEKSLQSHLSRLRRRLGVTDVGSARRYLATEPARPAVGTDPELRELTAREREVLALIARGLTNQQIADELVISLHTAIRHVANILGKTGAANRTEAARLASRLAHH